MNKIRFLIKGIEVGMDQSYNLILAEHKGTRQINIFLNSLQAEGIINELERKPNQISSVHKLFFEVSQFHGVEMLELNIIMSSDNIPVASLVSYNGQKKLSSFTHLQDALPISMHYHCPIFIQENLIEQVNTYYTLFELDIPELKTKLEQAIRSEEYEQASRLRDAIEKRKS